MGRLPGFIPENDDRTLMEVTSRTIGAQSLLVPAPEPRRFNEIVVGVMGRALEVSPSTRRITVLDSGDVERGPIPVIELPVRIWPVEPQARGHPP